MLLIDNKQTTLVEAGTHSVKNRESQIGIAAINGGRYNTTTIGYTN
jgi:hypothetical protein